MSNVVKLEKLNCYCCCNDDDLFNMLEPYEFDGKLEIYAEMITECFQIQIMTEEDDGNMYICRNCIYRLRDALDLRIQVQFACDRIQGLVRNSTVKSDVDHENKSSDEDIDEKEDFFSEHMDYEKKKYPKGDSKNTFRNENMLHLKNEIETCDNSYRTIEKLRKDETPKIKPCVSYEIFCKRFLNTEGTSKVAYFTCDYCDKIFWRKHVLNEHVKIHLNIKDYICDICKKSFVQKSTMRVHIISHMGVKKVKCEICKKLFTTKKNLKSHLKSHSNIKKFICDHCGKAFKNSSSIKLHLRTHVEGKKFQCELCKKSFITSGKLWKHSKIHKEVKDHVCKICGKGFAILAYLKSHMAVHSSERNFDCEFCYKSFSLKQSLKRHIKNLHIKIN